MSSLRDQLVTSNKSGDKRKATALATAEDQTRSAAETEKETRDTASSTTSTNSTSGSLYFRHGPPKKKFKQEMEDESSVESNIMSDDAIVAAVCAAAVSNTHSSSSVSCSNSRSSRSSDNSTGNGDRKNCRNTPAAAPPSPPPSFRKGGRIRLPDKLLGYLCNDILPDTIWWHEDGQGFAFDADKIQTKFLDKYFQGTKLTSFIRSLNRWYVSSYLCTILNRKTTHKTLLLLLGAFDASFITPCQRVQ